MDVFDAMLKPMKEFSKNSYRLVNKCRKPDAREYQMIGMRVSMGIVAMGFVGFFVKLVFIPIKSIIVGL